MAHHIAHAMCRLGMAAYWLEMEVSALLWNDQGPPMWTSVST